MAYCPNCRAEYVEDSTECIDCGSPLLPGSPPPVESAEEDSDKLEDVKLVNIRTFSGPTARVQADLARNLLKSQDIPCILAGGVIADTLPIFDIPLLVREVDVNQATEILKSYLDSPGPLPLE